MKKIYFLFLFFVFLSNPGFSQNCTDLIVTEIVFGNTGSTLTGEATSFNHSIEVYNPTDVDIDLGNYTIELLPEVGQKTIIALEGIVPTHDVFVISNITANAGITSVSDVLELLLSFQGKVAIQLTKTTGEVVDKFGKQGVETSSEVIDFNELLNNPDYLNSFDINLGSLQNLLIKRKGVVQKGKANFENEDLKKEWVILPNFEISNLGNHLNACNVPMIYWENIDQFEPEKILLEQEGEVFWNTGDHSDFVTGKVLLTEAHDENLVFSLFTTIHQYPSFDGAAAFSMDYNTTPLAFDFVIPAGQLSFEFDESNQLAWAIQDSDPEEGDEGFGIKVLAAIDGEIIADPDQNVLDVQIWDFLTNTNDVNLRNNQIKIYPIIASETIHIDNSQFSLKIQGVNILDIEGRLLKSFKVENQSADTYSFTISDISFNGYCILAIKTPQGIVAKKFFKK